MNSVDIIIPVHTSNRPIHRAVTSVITDTPETVQALVICHNTSNYEIKSALGDLAAHERVALINHSDGIPSPAGPRNLGLIHSRADYIGFLDSDDTFETGALAAWCAELAAAQAKEAAPDVLIGRFASHTRGPIYAPDPRQGRNEWLHPVKDLLNYRTAPVGALISRTLLTHPDSPGYLEEVRTGEDLPLGLYIWNVARSVHYSRSPLSYLMHEDAHDRVTQQVTNAADAFGPIHVAVNLESLEQLPKRFRQAIAVKLIRHQVLGWLHTVQAAQETGSTEVFSGVESSVNALVEVQRVCKALLRFAPGSAGFLSFTERAVVRAAVAGEAAMVSQAITRLHSMPYWKKIVTSNPLRSTAPESVLRGLIRARRRLTREEPTP